MIRKKTYYFYITRKVKMLTREFWNGHTWTTVVRFAKMYELSEAIEVMKKRFLKLEPVPRIRRASDFTKLRKQK